MYDRSNNELKVGDKVMIMRCDEYPTLVGRIATIMEQDSSPKIRVSLSDQWQGYFRGVDIEKYNELKTKKFYEYKITCDFDELNISFSEKEGSFVRTLKDKTDVYSQTHDGKNLFFVCKCDLDKVHRSHYFDEDNTKGYYEIYGMIEYEEGDESKKWQIQDKVKAELQKIAQERLSEIKRFIGQYEDLVGGGITVFSFDI